MSKKCARCEKTVYPIEELKCLDKVRKQIFSPFIYFLISDSLHYKVMCGFSFVILLMLCCRITSMYSIM